MGARQIFDFLSEEVESAAVAILSDRFVYCQLSGDRGPRCPTSKILKSSKPGATPCWTNWPPLAISAGLPRAALPQVRQAGLPLRGCGRPRPRAELVAHPRRRRQDGDADHSAARGGTHQGPTRGLQAVPRARPGVDRGQRGLVRGETAPGACGVGRRGQKGGFAAGLGAEIGAEIERLIGPGTARGLDFEALETADRRAVLSLAANAVAARLNADRSDATGSRPPCDCGGQARHAGRHARP